MIVNNLCKIFGKSFYSSSLLIFGWTSELNIHLRNVCFISSHFFEGELLEIVGKNSSLVLSVKKLFLFPFFCKLDQPVLLKAVFIPAFMFAHNHRFIFRRPVDSSNFLLLALKYRYSKRCNCH